MRMCRQYDWCERISRDYFRRPWEVRRIYRIHQNKHFFTWTLCWTLEIVDITTIYFISKRKFPRFDFHIERSELCTWSRDCFCMLSPATKVASINRCAGIVQYSDVPSLFSQISHILSSHISMLTVRCVYID